LPENKKAGLEEIPENKVVVAPAAEEVSAN
jgi:hypothetical protein